MTRIATSTGTMAFFLILALAHTSYAGIITDNFNDNTLDPTLWATLSTHGVGSVSETNQRLQVTLTGDREAGGVGLRRLALGNFDFQADYTLLSNLDAVSSYSGVALFAFALNGTFDGVVVGRGASPDVPGTHGFYLGGEGATDYGAALTSDQSGRLRLTRTGNVYSAYFWGSSDWVLLGSGTSVLTGPADLYLAVWPTGGETVSAAFDNLYLQADGFASVPEPGSFTLAAIALGLTCAIGRHRQPVKKANLLRRIR
jgi:hypothetical protein